MVIRFHFDVSSLQVLENNIALLEDNVARRLRKAVAEAMVTLIVDGFADSRDPYGVPWAPIKPYTRNRRDGSQVFRTAASQPLLDTGELRDSWEIDDEADRTFVGTELKHAEFHQSLEPRRVLPRRGMIPNTKDGLPAEYSREIEDTVTTFMRRFWA